MPCHEVVELLSAYYDGELPSDKHVAVEDHVAACADCAAELETLRKLSDLTMDLDQPSPLRHGWQRVEAQLRTNQSPLHPTQRTSQTTLMAVVALLLVGLCWITFSQWQAHRHRHLAVNFGRFLDSFDQAPEVAQQDLVKDYFGRPIEIRDAIRELKYRPVVADGLPADYELAQAYLLKMPCCQCLEVCYRRGDGRMLCIFEHDIDQPVSFGDRPASTRVCFGKPTRVVKVHGCLAATWQKQRRHITVIGAHDNDEVARFVAHFEQSAQTVKE